MIDYSIGNSSVTSAEAGGYSYNTDFDFDTSVSDIFGRFWNNISGKTAANQFNADEALKARKFESLEAAKNREWQENMSNTAYQRAAQDMKAAGLNPASLAGGSMDAASTPSGATAHSSAASSANSSNGGLLGLVGKVFAGVAGKVLASKISAEAMAKKSTAAAAKSLEQDTRTAEAAMQKLEKNSSKKSGVSKSDVDPETVRIAKTRWVKA